MSLPFVTLKEAAAALGVKPDTLRHACQDDHGRAGEMQALARRLNAQKPGRDWVVDREALNAELARRDGPAMSIRLSATGIRHRIAGPSHHPGDDGRVLVTRCGLRVTFGSGRLAAPQSDCPACWPR